MSAPSERALALHPENCDPAQLGAVGLRGARQQRPGARWLQRAVTMDPDDTNALYNGACVYALLGEPDHAIGMLERCFRVSGARTAAG